ncbi:MAG: ATP-binding protein [Candidatus Methanoperedens sp.]|nr:ATP-binding protein [Candidatus Methanoperedens sp.]
MLIEFSLENFRSIKEEVTLSLVASSDKSLDNNLITTEVLKKDNLLRSAVLYGANASGKSNVVSAINSLRNLVILSHTFQKGTEISYSPFKLDNEYLSKPTKFKVVFIKNNTKYVYGVSFTNEKIIDEYLYYYPEDRKAIIFERKDTNDYKFTINKKEQKFYSEKTLDNVLYLSSSTQLNYKKTAEAFDWFKNTLAFIGATDHPQLIDFTMKSLNKDATSKELILKALIEADLGINNVIASFEKISIDEIPVMIQKQIKFLVSQIGDDVEKMLIKTIHKVVNEKGEEHEVEFNFEEESEGTKRIFALIGPWIDALNNGRVLVVDELDTKLHHFLNLFLIKLFQDPTQNKNNAQLIFTTHNTNLLDLDLFRRDQIWFTEKDPRAGNTDLYSLIEFSPRKDKNVRKGYLVGRYGAIPFIGEERIF